MLQTTSEFNSMGAGGFGGGFGGIAPIGIISLNTLLGGRGFGNDGFVGATGAGSIPGTTVAEQNISELRKDVAGVNTTVEALGNELQGALAMQNLSQQAEFRNLDNRLCDSEKAALQAAYAATLQGMQNTQAIQAQMTSFQVSNDKEFCSIKSQINADGDATRALITQNLIDGLRNELLQERRGRENREIEINIANTANATQSQLQAQLQNQNQLIANGFSLFGDQINRQTSSIVNLGNMAGVGQTNTNANTKVNS